MFNLGLGEVLVVGVVALLVFGPDRLPEMVKQLAGWVRDLRAVVANARRDLGVSAGELGLDEDDVRTLRQLRNPKSFVRDKVLDDVGIDAGDFDLKKIAEGDVSPPQGTKPKSNGGPVAQKRPTPEGNATTSGFDPDAT